MKYLLDTCAVSDYFRRVGSVAERMHALAPHELAISTITEHEIRYGLARQPRAAMALGGKVRSFLSVVQALPFESRDAVASSTIQSSLEKAGSPIGSLDVLIAGVALARGLVLVTSNLKEFKKVKQLSIENWRSLES
jgi:tRNA(fMet)-specific endonuclease VapC